MPCRAATHDAVPKDTGDFRLMSRAVVDAFKEMPEQHRFVRGMVAWLGFTQVPIKYARDPRFAGSTKYPLEVLLAFARRARLDTQHERRV
jgi:polyisoprenyl-phosphate glycosyltransferase